MLISFSFTIYSSIINLFFDTHGHVLAHALSRRMQAQHYMWMHADVHMLIQGHIWGLEEEWILSAVQLFTLLFVLPLLYGSFPFYLILSACLLGSAITFSRLPLISPLFTWRMYRSHSYFNISPTEQMCFTFIVFLRICLFANLAFYLTQCDALLGH